MDSEVQISPIIISSPELLSDLNTLLPQLSDSFKDKEITEEDIEYIVESDDRDILVARMDDRIVGSAVVNLVVSLGSRKTWLDEFVVDEDQNIRGQGVGFALWNGIVDWATERGSSLEFTSSSSRKDAHRFYLRQGVEVRDTTVFRKSL